MPITQRHFNQLSEPQAERLAVLLEELGEAQQIIGKILRHGYESYHPDDPLTTNKQLLERELGDVLAAMYLMQSSGDVSEAGITTARRAKLGKVWEYLHHCGVPTPAPEPQATDTEFDQPSAAAYSVIGGRPMWATKPYERSSSGATPEQIAEAKRKFAERKQATDTERKARAFDWLLTHPDNSIRQSEGDEWRIYDGLVSSPQTELLAKGKTLLEAVEQAAMREQEGR